METAKDIFFPAVCPVCTDAIPLERRMSVRRLKRRLMQINADKPVGVPRKMIRAMYPAYVCRECIGEFEYIKAPYCEKCGKQLDGSEKRLCNDCAKKERSFIQTRCVITYDEAAQEIMAGLKYKSKREYAALLSLLAADRLSDWIKRISPDIIIPVPVHKERLLTRGYNQAELIAKGISELTKIPLNTEILYRTKNTKAQKALTADERLFNLLGAFEADASCITGADCRNATENKGMTRHRENAESYVSGNACLPKQVGEKGVYSPVVLLVDDIYTTGATMEACTTALNYAGIKNVYGLCICAGRDAPRIQVIKK